MPGENIPLFLVLAVGIGIVLGGTQALSRSFFSLLIPRGREAEYFSLYQASERGTSWLGTLVFGLVHQAPTPTVGDLGADGVLRRRFCPAPPRSTCAGRTRRATSRRSWSE